MIELKNLRHLQNLRDIKKQKAVQPNSFLNLFQNLNFNRAVIKNFDKGFRIILFRCKIRII